MKHNRLFGIIYLLLSHEDMTAKQLAEYFDVSIRTIYRDVEALSELHIPIYMSKGKHGGIGLLDHYKLDKMLLTDQEQNEILFSLQGIHKLQIDQSDVYQKMKNMFSKEEENWFEVDFSIWDKSDVHKKNFNSIQTAIIHKNVIKFLYFNSYGTSAERKVEPFKLYFKYNSWYLCGFDVDKKENRIFKIMRMKHLEVLDETFERKMENSFQWKETPMKTVQLILQIDQKLAYRVYDEFDTSMIRKQDDGDFIVTVEFPLNDWVYGYLLSFGEDVKILEPTDIRNEIIEKLKKTLNQYS